MSTATPDWTLWLDKPRARAWEWLALSVNVDPAELGLSHFLALRQSHSHIQWTSARDPEWLQELARRYRTLVNTRDREGTPLHSLDTEISATDFYAWVIARKWKLPPEIRDYIRAQESAGEPAPEAPPETLSETIGETSPEPPTEPAPDAAPDKRDELNALPEAESVASTEVEAEAAGAIASGDTTEDKPQAAVEGDPNGPSQTSASEPTLKDPAADTAAPGPAAQQAAKPPARPAAAKKPKAKTKKAKTQSAAKAGKGSSSSKPKKKPAAKKSTRSRSSSKTGSAASKSTARPAPKPSSQPTAKPAGKTPGKTASKTTRKPARNRASTKKTSASTKP